MRDPEELLILKTTFRALVGCSVLASSYGRAEQVDIVDAGAIVPFKTYEAENSYFSSSAHIVTLKKQSGRVADSPELEASGKAYVALPAPGDYLEVDVAAQSNGLVLRYMLPDATNGGGIEGSLSLYRNNNFITDITITSRYTWLYGKPGKNGQSNSPKHGQPHVFWDEVRVLLPSDLMPGDKLRITPGKDTKSLGLDLIELEHVPPPNPAPNEDTHISIDSCGASGIDEEDDTEAIATCFAKAAKENKSAWIPAGRYYQSRQLLVDGIKVSGAGMWHSEIISRVNDGSWRGNVGFRIEGSGAVLSDMFISTTALTSRSQKGGKAITGNGVHFLLENLWITHTNVGFWMGGPEGSTIRNNRVRMTYADGINVNRGAKDCVVEHNHVRGTGDDGIAVLSEIGKGDATTTNIKIRSNTVVSPWWGGNIDIAGGSEHVVNNNLLQDTVRSGALIINLPGAYKMRPLRNSMITKNYVVRGGGNLGRQRRGAVWIYTGYSKVQGVTFTHNTIQDAVYSGIHSVGTKNQYIRYSNNLIASPGTHGFLIAPEVNGRGIYNDNTVTDVDKDFARFQDKSGDGYSVEATGNSWQ